MQGAQRARWLRWTLEAQNLPPHQAGDEQQRPGYYPQAIALLGSVNI